VHSAEQVSCYSVPVLSIVQLAMVIGATCDCIVYGVRTTARQCLNMMNFQKSETIFKYERRWFSQDSHFPSPWRRTHATTSGSRMNLCTEPEVFLTAFDPLGRGCRPRCLRARLIARRTSSSSSSGSAVGLPTQTAFPCSSLSAFAAFILSRELELTRKRSRLE